MRALPALVAIFFTCAGVLHGEEPKSRKSASTRLFERLDTNRDGKVTLAEAPEQGKMLVEFLLEQSGQKATGQLKLAEFTRLTARRTQHQQSAASTDKAALEAVLGRGVQRAPENCPACAMGLTAEFVFKRLDVDKDKLITVTEFMRSPGMQDMARAREVVVRLDKNGDGKLSWQELQAAYIVRHANCKKPTPAKLAANAKPVRRDGRGNGARFAQVFILRSDKNGDGKISRDEFRGPAFGFNRLDKNGNGFIEANELGDLHQRRLNDPKSMRERLKNGDVPKPPRGRRPQGFRKAGMKK